MTCFAQFSIHGSSVSLHIVVDVHSHCSLVVHYVDISQLVCCAVHGHLGDSLVGLFSCSVGCPPRGGMAGSWGVHTFSFVDPAARFPRVLSPVCTPPEHMRVLLVVASPTPGIARPYYLNAKTILNGNMNDFKLTSIL